MQTPKASIDSRSGSSEVPQRKSPATPRTARQLKIPAADVDSSSSPKPANKTPKERSPNVTERRSPRSPAIEKKRPSRIFELESQISQLQEELKKTKDQLNSSEQWKRRAQQEAEDTKKQLEAMSAKLEDSQQQLMELSASEDDRVQELRKISHDRDKAWQSELEAVQKQHSMDSAALANAINEIQKLKSQLDKAVESEATQSKHTESAYSELRSLRMELTETLELVEKLKNELHESRESEAQALELVSKTESELEAANETLEMLQSDGVKATEAYNCLLSEIEESREKVKSLEELVRKLQENSQENVEDNGSNVLENEVNSLKLEVLQLRSALEASERRYQEEYIQSTLQIRSAYEQVETVKSESVKREAELEGELKKAKSNIEELKASLMDKETQLQSISEENKGLNSEMEKIQPNESESDLAIELNKLKNDFAEIKASLLDKDTQLQSVKEQNEMLKMEIEKGETERTKVNDKSIAIAMAAEREALMKLSMLTEEADKTTRRAARMTEQLDAAQAANTEMEAELRRLKVQSDQWRKAAEAAAAMLSTRNNGKITGPPDNSFNNTIGGTLGSPYSEDLDDESPKKKNMLKKIGVLWKKNQK